MKKSITGAVQCSCIEVIMNSMTVLKIIICSIINNKEKFHNESNFICDGTNERNKIIPLSKHGNKDDTNYHWTEEWMHCVLCKINMRNPYEKENMSGLFLYCLRYLRWYITTAVLLAKSNGSSLRLNAVIFWFI